MTRCENCGYRVTPGASDCPKCGAVLDSKGNVVELAQPRFSFMSSRLRFGIPALFTLAWAWLVTVQMWLVLVAIPHIIPDCKIGWKTTSTECGMLTSAVDCMLGTTFNLGASLYVLTIPWLILGVALAVIEARRAKALA
jgi:hypothetical protein